jgi:YHS domain-containing protein
MVQRRRMSSMAIDPVCKMTVDEEHPAATSVYKGQTYYFCATGCKSAFDEDPERYLQGPKKRSLLQRMNPFSRKGK